jgi:DNA adenine methylase
MTTGAFPTAAPFAWYGGKQRMAPAIVNLLPPHRTYVEAFGGAAAVLCAKRPAVLEVYNDVDAGLVTFFRVLRDRPEELERALRLTPYARDEFAQCVQTWEAIEDDLERARRWYVRCRQAFAGSAATVGWGYEISGVQRAGTRASSFATSVEQLERFAERFRRVQIDQLGWEAVLERYDGPQTCWYLDPPYHPATRGERGLRRNAAYVHELDAAGHDDLVAAAIALKGSVVISGYDHESYRPLVDAGFERFTFAHNASASRVFSGRGVRTEVVWRRLEAGVHHISRLWSDDEASLASDVDDGQIPGQLTVEQVLADHDRKGAPAS